MYVDTLKQHEGVSKKSSIQIVLHTAFQCRFTTKFKNSISSRSFWEKNHLFIRCLKFVANSNNQLKMSIDED